MQDEHTPDNDSAEAEKIEDSDAVPGHPQGAVRVPIRYGHDFIAEHVDFVREAMAAAADGGAGICGAITILHGQRDADGSVRVMATVTSPADPLTVAKIVGAGLSAYMRSLDGPLPSAANDGAPKIVVPH